MSMYKMIAFSVMLTISNLTFATTANAQTTTAKQSTARSIMEAPPKVEEAFYDFLSSTTVSNIVNSSFLLNLILNNYLNATYTKDRNVYKITYSLLGGAIRITASFTANGDFIEGSIRLPELGEIKVFNL